MPLPEEVLDSVKEDIDQGKALLAELKDVITDMRLSGMDTTKEDEQYATLSSDVRKLEVFYERQKAKSPGSAKGKAR